MTDFDLFVVLFGTGLGFQVLGLGLRRRRDRHLSAWRSPAWRLWAAGVVLILVVAVRDRDLVLAGGQVMGALVLHRWLFQSAS